jgi:hypothetical protein
VDVKDIVGKVVFYKASDTINHPVEKLMGQWVVDFHELMSRVVSEPIKYSELRPAYLD